MTAKATATPNTAMTKTATTTTTATTTGSGWVGALQAGWYDRLASDRENASVSAAATASPASDNAMPAGLLVVRPPTGLLVVQQRRIYAAHMVATSSEPTQFKVNRVQAPLQSIPYITPCAYFTHVSHYYTRPYTRLRSISSRKSHVSTAQGSSWPWPESAVSPLLFFPRRHT